MYITAYDTMSRSDVRAVSLQSIIDNYMVYQALWEELRDVLTNSEIRARLVRVEAMTGNFDFLFGLVLARRTHSKAYG